MRTGKAVIVTAAGFQDEEFIYPYYRLQEAGFQVEVATRDGLRVVGKNGNPAAATMSTTDLCAEDFDMVLIPGGFEAPDRVRILPEVLQFIRDMDRQGKLVAAICHGPWVLISADILRGRRATAYWSIEADMRNAGAEYLHKTPVVVDRNLITAPHYNNNADFMKAVVEYFAVAQETHA